MQESNKVQVLQILYKTSTPLHQKKSLESISKKQCEKGPLSNRMFLLLLVFHLVALGSHLLPHRGLLVAGQQCGKSDVVFDPLLERQIRLGKASFSEQFVHLFERQALGLRQDEIDPDGCNHAHAPEENECTELRGVDEGRGADADGEVVLELVSMVWIGATCSF